MLLPLQIPSECLQCNAVPAEVVDGNKQRNGVHEARHTTVDLKQIREEIIHCAARDGPHTCSSICLRSRLDICGWALLSRAAYTRRVGRPAWPCSAATSKLPLRSRMISDHHIFTSSSALVAETLFYERFPGVIMQWSTAGPSCSASLPCCNSWKL